MPRKRLIGVVTSDKMNKTRRVDVPRLVKHPKYGKYIRRRTVCYVHDENNESKVGDTVEIIESRPRSRLKRWELVRIVSRAVGVDLALLRRRRREEEVEEADVAEGLDSENSPQQQDVSANKPEQQSSTEE